MNGIEKIVNEWDDDMHKVTAEPVTLKTLAKRLHDTGYRLDSYSDGKSKDELLAIIEVKEGELAKARNLLTATHDSMLNVLYDGTPMMRRNLHAKESPSCGICTFLAETSTVKS